MSRPAFIRPLWAVALVLSAAVVVHATSLDLSDAGGMNLLTWGNATLQNSDVQGRVAAGGNVSFSSYSIGTNASNASPTDASLIVGGNLTAGNGQVYNGSIYVGGSYTGPGYNLNSAPGSVTKANLGSAIPFNFSSAQSSLTSRSATYGAAAATGSSVVQYSTLTLTGANAGLNIFDITATQLASVSTLTINVPAGAYVLVNVSGSSATFSNMGINGTFSAANTLFNFYQTGTLSMSGIGVQGSILAPYADVSFATGQMNGQLIANSFTGLGELHATLFNSQPSVPDSGSTVLLLVLGSVGVILFAKWRKPDR